MKKISKMPSETRGRKEKYFLADIKIGRGIVIDCLKEEARLMACRIHSSARNAGVKVRTVFDPDVSGLKIWRVS